MSGDELFRVGPELPDLARLMAAVADPGHGAVVSFLGVVRDESDGSPVAGLEYSAYEEMARRKLREIGDEIQARYGPLKVAAAHRTGHLAVGEVSFALAVGAAHRQSAFRAAAHFVDRLKEIVPIWKQGLPVEEDE